MKEGDYVHYKSRHGAVENGRIKSMSPSGETAWVVFHCNNEWDEYMDYTGQAADMEDIYEGWADANGNSIHTPE